MKKPLPIREGLIASSRKRGIRHFSLSAGLAREAGAGNVAAASQAAAHEHLAGWPEAQFLQPVG